MERSFEELSQELAQQRSIAELKQCFKKQIALFGYVAFDAFSYHLGTIKNLRQDGNYYIASYGLDYLEQFVDQGMTQECPVVQRISQSSFPFDYVQALEEHKHKWAVKFQLRLLKLFNVHHAWIIPFNTIDQVKGVTLYMQGTDKMVYERFLSNQAQIQWISTQFVKTLETLTPSISMVEMLKQKKWNQAILSAREVQCLKYCSQGLTYSQIGTKLRISENTIRYHMKNIFRKLNVKSRSEAIALSKHAYR